MRRLLTCKFFVKLNYDLSADILSERAARVQGERWCATAELTRIADLVKEIQEPTKNMSNNAFTGEFQSWIIDMEEVTVTPGEQQDAVINEVLPSLNTFLSLDL